MKMIQPKETKTVPQDFLIKSKTPVNFLSIEAITPETDYMVRGTFINVETPGQTAAVNVLLYKGMKFFSKVFKDNERCVIPYSVARFINERVNHQKHKYSIDESGNPVKVDDAPIARYKFIVEEKVT